MEFSGIRHAQQVELILFFLYEVNYELLKLSLCTLLQIIKVNVALLLLIVT